MFSTTATVGRYSNYLAAHAAGEPVLQVEETELEKVWRRLNQSLNKIKMCSYKNEMFLWARSSSYQRRWVACPCCLCTKNWGPADSFIHLSPPSISAVSVRYVWYGLTTQQKWKVKLTHLFSQDLCFTGSKEISDNIHVHLDNDMMRLN